MTQGRCSICANGTSIFFASKKKMSISFSTRLNFVYLRWYITLIGKHEKIRLRGCSYGGELTRLGGLARVGEMIFIPRSHGIFYLSSIKKFVMSLEKDFHQAVFTINSDVKPLCRTYVLIAKQSWLKKTLSRLAGSAHLRMFI